MVMLAEGMMTFRRGIVETPAFMPAATYGTIKGRYARRGQGYWNSDFAGQYLSPMASPRSVSQEVARRFA